MEIVEIAGEAVTVLETLLLGCDESVMGMDFLNDYNIDCVSVADFAYKDKITDGSGKVIFAYDAHINPIQKDKYFRLNKKWKDSIALEMEAYKAYAIPNKDLADKLERIRNKEEEYIYRVLDLLRVYKTGNIGVKHIFVNHKISVAGMNGDYTATSINENRNITNTKKISQITKLFEYFSK